MLFSFGNEVAGDARSSLGICVDLEREGRGIFVSDFIFLWFVKKKTPNKLILALC